MNSVNKEIPLKMYDPDWGSPLASVIIELEKLRVTRLGGPVPPYIFFQLKNIFHIFESLGSARIEGNHTTLSEFVERIIEDPTKKETDDGFKEIYNIERAIDFIEKQVNKETIFDRALISEIHKILVSGLTPPPSGEGSKYPGQLRPINVSIKGSAHTPPESIKILDYFDELLTFVNSQTSTQYHLLATALAHHRMAWIHPFDNGNGRLIRMFTYALLIKQGFEVKSGRILNPTAIFCMDRDKYYEMLALADSGEREKTLTWCFYVLDGLKNEIEKIDRLLDLSYMTTNILLPVLTYALEREHITKREFAILSAVVKNPDMCIKSSSLEGIIGKESSVQRSRIIKRLKEKQMLIPLREKGRIYTIGFANNYLLRGVVHVLEKNGFIPASLNQK
uniref:Filamentation induced by cAMP protein Fic n=1 Tax=Candidatus Nitrotoga fabula TaxID=2182327 RepID=A0A2X0QSY0_9PROT|nr:Filamentation induced by cAMP protein Fic [Candidatus Nitrotoga fabula]